MVLMRKFCMPGMMMMLEEEIDEKKIILKVLNTFFNAIFVFIFDKKIIL
jgi:hypothetical protein